MSKHQIVRSLRQEIRRINYIIDQKIIKGISYYSEARKHKFLVSQLNRISPQKSGIFGRALSFMSVFMF